MQNTHFDSPHGLMNIQNVSTAYDMARLLTKAMSLSLFRRIVSTKHYSCGCNKQQLESEIDKWFEISSPCQVPTDSNETPGACMPKT